MNDTAVESRFQPVLHAFDPNGEIEIRQRNLPHWRQPGATYFVTFRLGDALPRRILDKLRSDRRRWLEEHGVIAVRQAIPGRPSSAAASRFLSESYRAYRVWLSEQIENYLAAGYGACWLRSSDVREIVENSLAHFDGERYTLDDYVIMPNHAHAIVTPRDEIDLSSVMHSWKSYTANRINRLVGRKGRLWQDESYDHIVRDEDELIGYRRYIADNPRRARLRDGEYSLRSGAFDHGPR